jgi:hypothetical protein
MLGTAWIRRHRVAIAIVGLVSLTCGIMLFVDCLDGVVYFRCAFSAT